MTKRSSHVRNFMCERSLDGRSTERLFRKKFALWPWYLATRSIMLAEELEEKSIRIASGDGGP